MKTQKNITLQVSPSVGKVQTDFTALNPTMDCHINIQVADRWTITGHYRNQILETITLQKICVSGNCSG